MKMEQQLQFKTLAQTVCRIRNVGILATLLVASGAHAQSDTLSPAVAPLIVILPDSTEFKAGENMGLIGYLIDKSENKRTGAQVENFRKQLDDGELSIKISEAFACLNVRPADSKCREVVFAGTRDNIPNLVRDKNYVGAIELRLVTLMSDQRYWARAIVTEYSNAAGKVKIERRYSASYETRAPAELTEKAKTDPAPLQQYWFEGEPTRLKSEVLASIPELRNLLTWIAENSTGSSPNKSWKDLPNLKGLRDAGRIQCRALGCTALHLVKESNSRLWLVGHNSWGIDLGPVVTSVDENAARNGIFPYNMANTGH